MPHLPPLHTPLQDARASPVPTGNSTLSSGQSTPLTAYGSRTRLQERTQLPRIGSHTMVVTQDSEQSSARSEEQQGILILRGEHGDRSREETEDEQADTRVRWSDDTIDNENMNKKKSKVCCIFHKQRRFDESDSDESSNDSDNSDGDGPNEYERMPSYKKHAHCRHNHSHNHSNLTH